MMSSTISNVHLFIFWAVVILFLVLAYHLLKYYIKSHKGRYDLDKNYILVIAVGVLLAAFILINPSTSKFLANIALHVVNTLFDTRYEVIQSKPSGWDFTLFLVFSLSVVAIFWLAVRDRRWRLQEKEREGEELGETERKRVIYPDPLPPESPHLQERIKELFELKYKKRDLTLKQPADNEKVLYGSYADDFNAFLEVVYCDDRKGVMVSASEQQGIYDYLQESIVSELRARRSKDNLIVRCHYILTEGSFEPCPELTLLKCQTEDEFLKNLINFSKYLKDRLLYDYRNNKIFSAIAKQEEKKTLAETFIAPSFFVGDNNALPREDLKSYMDGWINNTSDNKHLVLLGDYGMGKTSFVKYYAAALAEEILDGKPFKRFPVFISLTNTSPRHGGISKSVEAFVARHLGVDYALFEKLVHKGKILFIFDAFDEMGYIGTHEQRFKQFNEIWQLAFKNNKMLLVGRPSYFPTEFELKQILNVPKQGHEPIQVHPYSEKLTLNELDDERIRAYIAKYYPERTSQYMEWVVSNKSIHDLCKRPSMTHIIREMLPKLFDERDQKTLNAAETMERYINYWFDRQEVKGVPSAFEQYSPRKKTLILDFFKDLAADFYLNHTLKADNEAVLQQLRQKIEAENIEELQKKEFLEGFENEILSGYFIEIEDDEYKFAHKSFYEYFVALKIFDLLNAKDLKHKLLFEEWTHEVVDFVYDSIPENFREHKKIPALFLMSINNKLVWHVYMYEFDAIIKLRHMDYEMSFFRLPPLILHILFAIIFIAPVQMYYSMKYASGGSLGLLGLLGLSYLFRKFYVISAIKKQFDYKKNIGFLYWLVQTRFIDLFDLIEDVKFKEQSFSYDNILWLQSQNKDENLSLSDAIKRVMPIFPLKFSPKGITWNEMKLKNIEFVDCKFRCFGFIGVEFEEVHFEGCLIKNYMIFENCTFTKVTFKNIHIRDKIKFTGNDPAQMDIETLNNLRHLVQGQQLEIGKHIIGDEWLMEELKKQA